MAHETKRFKLAFFGLKFTVFLILEVVLLVGAICLYYRNRILPGVRVGNERVGGMQIASAEEKLYQKAKELSQKTAEVKFDGQTFARTYAELGITFRPTETTRRAFLQVRANWVLLLKDWLSQKKVGTIGWEIDEGDGLTQFASEMAGRIDIPAIEPSLRLSKDGKTKTVQVLPGAEGRALDAEKLVLDIRQAAKRGEAIAFEAPVVRVDPKLTQEEVVANQTRGNNLVRSTIALKLDQDEWKLDGEAMLNFMAFPVGFDEGKISDWVETLSTTVNREPANALFSFSAGKVEAFRPAKDGVKLAQRELVDKLLLTFANLSDSSGERIIRLPVERTKPLIGNEQVNTLGIKELIGMGKSVFHGSIPNRVHNLSLAASRINGALVSPGETFSFNSTVGDISKNTGYKEAYVISQGRTVLGDGGGVCQVSTTLFRAVLDAGLPVEQRTAHAYRVHYYEEDTRPGIDATVFAPSTDFKFRNDTPGYILVQTSVDKKNYAMRIELYGTKDGRVSIISNPVILSQTPPPPDLYQDDPTLPAGTTKQIDWSAWGAKVTFKYKVTRNGESLIDQVFTSNYKPWQAVYLRGVK